MDPRRSLAARLREARRAGLAVVAGSALVAGACAGPEAPAQEVANPEEAFQELLARPEHRAMALALDNHPRLRWVYGRAWGRASSEDALAEAFSHCDEQRRLQGVRSPCRTYAVGSERVWGKTPR